MRPRIGHAIQNNPQHENRHRCNPQRMSADKAWHSFLRHLDLILSRPPATAFETFVSGVDQSFRDTEEAMNSTTSSTHDSESKIRGQTELTLILTTRQRRQGIT